MLKLIQTSSLEKILPKLTCKSKPITGLTVLSGERVSYQIGYTTDELSEYEFTVESELENIKIYDVKNVPVMLPACHEALEEPDYISKEPGLFPDLLEPKTDNIIKPQSWYASLWFMLESDKPGEHSVTVTFKKLDNKTNEAPISVEFVLTVLPFELPKQKLIYTQWLYTDCISKYYGVEAFSEKHWSLIEEYIKVAADYGINMLLTPIFTPPLDTEIGGERPTVQLVEIKKDGPEYSYNFDKLIRWIDLCKKCGIKYFEMAHLFTQWGSKATPKIMATVDGEYKRIFGWDVAADDKSYSEFLSSFLPQLTEQLKNQGIAENTFFHISDEPSTENIENYKKAKAIVSKYLSDFKIIDALSDYEFYESGAVEHPIPATTAVQTFIDKKVPDLWTYYCCGQFEGVSNRFIAMPSWRNRCIASQLFKYNVKGFLHWGFNFYFTFLSKRMVNPFYETDAGCRLPSGDSFSVYPGENGPLLSIRLVVFYEALQDLRSMELLSSYIGHDKTVEFLEKTIGENIIFSHCAGEEEKVLNTRQCINDYLLKLSEK